ncbi:MAG: CDF family Co(II)/Ni(II) efflux transporter DmeF, partial [Gluconacetobacter diazotrophicus]|nr:CDF family Co(II)/Ni(II) efflux transporter DmeF [Gluconacetobacter diazotrophicus]
MTGANRVETVADFRQFQHSHDFLGDDHERAERRTWWVIALCGLMMLAEVVGGLLVGSIALVADGLHMSTHAGALLLAAMAYRLARRYLHDDRFTFGTGKLGDLAGFGSAIMLAMIAVLIGYEAVDRLLHPVPIRFGEAIPIACLGLAVNVASVWLLASGGHHHHGHGHGHRHAHDHGHGDEHRIPTPRGTMLLDIVESGHPPLFRLRAADGATVLPTEARIRIVRPDGTGRDFLLERRGELLLGTEGIPEPHGFAVRLEVEGQEYQVAFVEHDHDPVPHRDNNLRAAIVHVAADAAVSMLVILGLVLAELFGWSWMDPLAGIVGAGVIAGWSYGLIRDTGAILLDMTPDRAVRDGIRQEVEREGDRLADLHVWRLGPGHLGAILCVVTGQPREAEFYRERLARFPSLSHL